MWPRVTARAKRWPCYVAMALSIAANGKESQMEGSCMRSIVHAGLAAGRALHRPLLNLDEGYGAAICFGLEHESLEQSCFT